MVFSSFVFLVGFLPAFLTLYYLTPGRYRNHVALLASYAFYSWGAPKFAFVLLASSLADYLLGRLITETPPERTRRRRLLLATSLTLNLGLLAFFKYANFFVAELNALLNTLGFGTMAWIEIALPIGISFFTFQKITYIVDVYRGDAQPARSFVDYALYVAMFPQLIAGPIIRYHDIAGQLRARTHSAEKFFTGMWRFCLGLGKKVLVADALAEVAVQIYEAETGALGAGYAWLGLVAFAFQIYFDFAGYSDMAIGLGRMLGFQFRENFNCPYVAASFTEFWRRWHISLSDFMRRYLYIPLGGNRVGHGRWLANLWIVFLASGLWHGAAWPFVIWGVYHGLFLSLEKLFAGKQRPRLPRPLGIAVTFLLVTLGWAFFQAGLYDDTIADAQEHIERLLPFASQTTAEADVELYGPISRRAMAILVLAAAISFLPAIPAFERFAEQVSRPPRTISGIWVRYALAMSLLVLSFGALAVSHFHPFIYFRF